MAAALLAATAPLWGTSAPFPQVPLFGFARNASAVVDQAALVALVGGLLLVVGSGLASRDPSEADGANPDSAVRRAWLARRVRRAGWLQFLGAAVALVVSSQQRWQPWLWHGWLLAGLFVVESGGGAVRPARLIVVGLYLHSAVSKLDAGFLQTHGPELVNGLLANVGAALPPRGAVRTLAAAALPLGELTCAALLLVPRTRRAGLVVSIIMHLALMAALGPWGLDHQPGVLIWNAGFVAQNLLLFRRSAERYADAGVAGDATDAGVDVPRTPAAQSGSRGANSQGANHEHPVRWLSFVLLATALPVAGWFEQIDPWLGWGLYSSRHARVRFDVDESAVDRLPVGLRPFVEPPAPLERWRRVRLDRWSLAALRAPLSPQARVHVGVALEMAREANLNDDCRLIVESPASRATGRRESITIEGAATIEAAASRFRLNALPRRSP